MIASSAYLFGIFMSHHLRTLLVVVPITFWRTLIVLVASHGRSSAVAMFVAYLCRTTPINFMFIMQYWALKGNEVNILSCGITVGEYENTGFTTVGDFKHLFERHVIPPLHPLDVNRLV